MMRGVLLFLASVLVFCTSLFSWRCAARAHLSQARHALASRVVSMLDAAGPGGKMVEKAALHDAVDSVSQAFFGAAGTLSFRERLLAVVVYDALAPSMAGGGTPGEGILVPAGRRGQALAARLVTGAELDESRDEVLQPGAVEDAESWRHHHGSALTKLNLADALDLAEPLPGLYVQRAAILISHPQVQTYLGEVEADIALDEQIDTRGDFAGLRSYLARCVALEKSRRGEGARPIRPSRFDGHALGPTLDSSIAPSSSAP